MKLALIYLLMITPTSYVYHPGPMAGWTSKLGITINTKYTNNRDMVMLHEAGHVAGLGHCEKGNCLMYPKKPYWFDKNLCNDCEVELCRIL